MANGIMFIDLEVDNHPYYGAIASPRHEDNYVVMVGWAIDYGARYSGKVEHLYFKNKEESKKWLNIPEDIGLIVAHNLSFELDWIWEQHYEELKSFVNRGGRFWCTALAEYRLTRQQHLYPSLNEVAVKYGGNVKLDLVAEEWKSGKLTSEIDTDLLRDYLVGTPKMEGDIGNTRLAFYGQWDAATEKGMLKAILKQNNALIYNSVCMSVGLKVDMEVAQANLNRLQDRVDEIDYEFEKIRLQFGLTPEENEGFNSGTGWDMSPFLFGGLYKYKTRVPSVDGEGNVRYVKVLGAIEEGTNREIPVVEEHLAEKVCEGLNVIRYKSGMRKGDIKLVKIDSEEVKLINGELGRELEGIVNLKQFPETFVEGWTNSYITKNVRKWEGKEYPIYATSEEAVEALIERRELSEEARVVMTLMLERAILDKAIGSFYDKQTFYKNGSPKKRSGMFQHVTPDHRIHPSINAVSTVTGRLSCTKPAMQTMPRDDKKGVMKSNVKEMFVSRWGERGRLVEIDYSNLEGRGLADLTGDPNLAKIVSENMDVLCLSVAEDMDLPYEYVFERAKGNPDHPDHDEFSQRRQDMKPAQYAYNYGASAHGIAYGTGWDLSKAEKFVERQKKRAPQAEVFFDEVAAKINSTRVVKRVKLDDGTYKIGYEGYLKANSGFEYHYNTYPKTIWVDGRQVKVDEFKPTEMRNYIIQGDSGFFVQVITGKIIRHMFSIDFYNKKCYPIMTVHDQVLLDVHEDVLEEVIQDTVEIMENVPKYMSRLGYDLKMPYPVEATVGMNWQDQKSLSEVGIKLKEN